MGVPSFAKSVRRRGDTGVGSTPAGSDALLAGGSWWREWRRFILQSVARSGEDIVNEMTD